MKKVLLLSALACLSLTDVVKAVERVRHYDCVDPFGKKMNQARFVSIATDEQLATPLKLKSAIIFTEVSRPDAEAPWVKDSSYELEVIDTDLLGSYPILGKGIVISGGWVRAVRTGGHYVEVIIPIKMIAGDFRGIFIQESRPLANGTSYEVQAWNCFNPDAQL